MDMNALEFMAKEMLTTDIDTQRHIEEMFIREAQAGKEIAEEGANLRRLQQRYNMVPKKIPQKGYPQEYISNQKLIGGNK